MGLETWEDQVSHASPLLTGVTNYGFREGLDFTPPVDGYPLMYMTGWK